MNTEEFIEEVDQRIENWADSYDSTTSYTMGKIVGAKHAVHIMKQVAQE